MLTNPKADGAYDRDADKNEPDSDKRESEENVEVE